MNTKTARTTAQVRQSILDLGKDLKSHFADMDDTIDGLILGLVSGQNVCLLGLPGLAKTNVVERLRQGISGSKYFYRNLDDSTMPSQLFGGLDAKKLMDTGHEVHMTAGFAPEAHIVALDEAFKCNSMSLNSLLPFLNEGIFVNDGKVVHCEHELVVAMSNEYPRKGLDALWDRFPIRVWCEDPVGPDAFAKLWDVKPNAPVVERLSIDELRRIRDEVQDISIGAGNGPVANSMFKIRAELDKKGIRISPRRVKVAQKILQAHAWLTGEAEVAGENIEALAYVLWDQHSQRPEVESVIATHIVSETAEMKRYFQATLILMSKVPHDPPAGDSTSWRNEAGSVSREVKRACDLIDAAVNKATSDRAKRYGRDCIKKLTAEAQPMRQSLRDATGI